VNDSYTNRLRVEIFAIKKKFYFVYLTSRGQKTVKELFNSNFFGAKIIYDCKPKKNLLNILTACSSIKTTSGCRKECKSKLRVRREM
jgi:hypothetical protein